MTYGLPTWDDAEDEKNVEYFEDIEGDVTSDDQYRLVSPKKLDSIEDLVEELRAFATSPIYHDDRNELVFNVAYALHIAHDIQSRMNTLVNEIHKTFKVAKS